ncbi:MAG: hypothetical protein ABSF44_04615 [Candidatus Bathyarchaeia archaeon]|jgi:uncharacterized membrane protein
MATQVKMKLRTSTALFLTMTAILVVAFSGRVQAQTYIQYKIQLNSDDSATWNIIQVSGLNGTVDSWGGFEGKVTALINAAADQTNRQMTADSNSFQMSTFISSSDSKSTGYTFTWLNFSVNKHGQLVAGDVFSLAGFFDRLYGDGELQISYPANYTLQSVVPTPDQKDPSTQSLDWLGTQFFVASTPQIVLDAQSVVKPSTAQLSPFILPSVAVVAVIAAVTATWFLFVNRRQKIRVATALPISTLPESEEEKVLRLLRSNSGGTYQSAVTEQCRFSKAKTSQLLSALEREGKVRRYKKGRDKIVSLVEPAKGEK